MPRTIAEIRELARNYNGQCTVPFSQAEPPISDFLSAHADNRIGICAILCMKWMADLAGESERDNHLFKADGSVNEAQLAMLAATDKSNFDYQRTSTGWRRLFRPSKSAWHENFVNWLITKNLVRHKALGGKGVFPEVLNMIVGSIVQRAIVPVPLQYLAISLYSPRVGHMVALDLRELNNINFFEPNYGQFTFATIDDWRDWLSDVYQERQALFSAVEVEVFQWWKRDQ